MYATDTSKYNTISDDDSSLFSPLPSSLFLPHHCNQHPFAPSCIFVSFISAHIIVTVSKSSYQLWWGETTFDSVCSLSFSLSPEKCYHSLILVAITSSFGVTAFSYPTLFSSQIESRAVGDRANVPHYCRWAVGCKLNCKAHSLPHHSAHIKTKGNDSPIVIYYLAPSAFDH